MQVEIYSEIAPLKSVILHKPGEEHFFINPNNLNEWIPGNNKLINNPDYLLFDDLINHQRLFLHFCRLFLNNSFIIIPYHLYE